MHYFSAVPEGQAITLSRGLYRQAPLFVRESRLYVKVGTAYVRLHQAGATSLPNMKWLEIDPGDGEYREAKGSITYVTPKADVTE